MRTPRQQSECAIFYSDGRLRPFFVCAGNAAEAMTRKEAELEALLAPTVQALGCAVWGIEYRPWGRGRGTLKLYIDSATGVSIDDCERVSHQVSALLDVEDPIGSSYRLEVSSPGFDRVLFRREQFVASIGEGVNVKLAIPFDGQRRFEGRLIGLEGEDVVLRNGDEEYLLPFDQIERARILPNFADGGSAPATA